MATVSQEELLQRLQDAGIAFDSYDHAPVATVEAMAQELSKQGVEGICTKNLFLKDKKNRLYIITARPETKVDLKLLSARLGLGKGGLRFAPEELLAPVLAVRPGAVTPVALVQGSAEGVVLLLDEALAAAGRLLVHPLVNTATLAMSGAALHAFLTSLGRNAHYVDLEADPKIDKDSPPDLAPLVASAASVSNEELAAKASIDPAALSASAAAPATGRSQGGRAAAKAAGGGRGRADASAQRQGGAGAGVEEQADELVARITALVSSGGLGEARLRTLVADVAMQLNTLRNDSYAKGFAAGRGAPSPGVW